MTRAEALEILAGGQFGRFVGTPEGLEVEFKGAPYYLDGADEDRRKFELANDVSARANAAGGVIVIGAGTIRDDETRVDVVSEINLLGRGLVDPAQYQQVISGRVDQLARNRRSVPPVGR